MKSKAKREKQNPNSATCKLCGEIMEPDERAMALHLFSCHPLEYLQSKSGITMLQTLSRNLFEFGRHLTRGMK